MHYTPLLLIFLFMTESRPRIEDALSKDEWVIMDRYTPSHAAYSLARGIPLQRSLELLLGSGENNNNSNKGSSLMPRADLVVWLDGDAEGVLRRVVKRERFDRVQFQEQVRQGLEQCMRVDRQKWIKIEECHLLDIDTVHNRIVEAIQSIMK